MGKMSRLVKITSSSRLLRMQYLPSSGSGAWASSSEIAKFPLWNRPRMMHSISPEWLNDRCIQSLHRCYSASSTTGTIDPQGLVFPEHITPKLVTHVNHLIQRAVEDQLRSITPEGQEIDHEQSKRLSQLILRYAIEEQVHGKSTIDNNRDLFELGTQLSKVISKVSPQDLLKVFTIQTDVIAGTVISYNTGSGTSTNTHTNRPSGKIIQQWIDHYDQTMHQNHQIFQTITNHHRNVAEHDWQENVNNHDSLFAYSQAASSMGKKPWVKESNEWMADFIMSYYRFGGARKYFCKKYHIGKYDRIDQRYHTLSKDLMVVGEVEATTVSVREGEDTDVKQSHNNHTQTNNKLIRILDVGSCYNPLQSSSHASTSFDITAIDLYPADSNTVFQCDFLHLQIGPEGSQPIYRYDPQNPEKKVGIIQLPAHSFDAITMSLVLSYLSSPSQREAMIAKARQLLVTPSPPYPIVTAMNASSDSNSSDTKHTASLLAPHHSGLLLIVEKESIFSRHRDKDVMQQIQGSTLVGEWKKAISGYGFDLIKYSLLPAKDGHRSHTFAFATVPDEHNCSQTEEVQEDKSRDNDNESEKQQIKHRMWIQQDFTPSSSSASSDTSKSFNSTHEQSDNGISKDNTCAATNTEGNQSKTTSTTTSTPALLRYNKFYLPVGIVGGGIGGTALALSLQHHGIPFQLFEKDKDFTSRRQGYALTMQQGGIALRELDVVQEVIDEGAISIIHYSYDAKGKVIGAYGAGKLNPTLIQQPAAATSSATPSSYDIKQRHNIHLPRQKLREILMKRVNQDHVYWSKKLSSFSSPSSITKNSDDRDQEYVTVTFDDNTKYDVSVLVGADGVFSTVRQQLLSSLVDPSLDLKKYQQLSYLNMIVILGISNQRSTLDGENGHLCVRQWLDGNNRIFSMPYDKEKTMWQMSFPMKEEDALQLSSWNKHSYDEMTSIGKKLREEVMKRCVGWDSSLLEILCNTQDSDISGHPVYDRDPDLGVLPRRLSSSDSNSWTMPPRVTLLGDAVHPMSPFKGQGANQALLDALHLSRALLSSNLVNSNRRSIPEALNDFEQDMLIRSRLKVLKSRDAAIYLHSEAALAEGNITRAKAAQLLYKKQT